MRTLAKPQDKKSKEAREKEFVDAIEQILGAHLLPWQRELVVRVRNESLAGRGINMMELQALVKMRRG